MIDLLPVHDLHSVWAWVRAGLEECRERCMERWLPEDVYIRIKTGNAVLFLVYDASERVGFVIVEQHADFDGPCLFVWIIWGKGLSEYEYEIYQALEDKAREIKAKRIRMQSPRRGWERKDFFKAVSVNYEREV